MQYWKRPNTLRQHPAYKNEGIQQRGREKNTGVVSQVSILAVSHAEKLLNDAGKLPDDHGPDRAPLHCLRLWPGGRMLLVPPFQNVRDATELVLDSFQCFVI
jgi:hypothetical protein